MVKIGIVGAGNIAETHADSYKKLDNAKLEAVCDINVEKAKAFAQKHGIQKVYASVDEMVAGCELDAADVCVWNCNHAECAIKAMRAGLDVLCEKPMAYNTEQAEEMLKVSKETGKLLMIGFVMRFSKDAKVIQDFINKDYFGEIYYTKATYLRRHGNPGGWFGNKALSGGGPVIDLGVHVIDHTRYMMGSPKPVSVYAATFDKLTSRKYLKNKPGWVPKDAKPDDISNVEDMAVAIIRYDNGAVTLLETSYDMNGVDHTAKQIFGTKGGADLAGDPKFYMEINDVLVDVTPEIKTIGDDVYGKSSFDGEMEHFVNCVEGKEKCMATAEDGVVIMKILDAIYKSAATGHEVILD